MHIVFKILSQHSHLNATYKLASMLSAKNYRITYSGTKEFEKDVLAKGFEYFVDTDAPIPSQSFKKISFLKKLAYRKVGINRSKQYAKGRSFERIIDTLNPDLMVVDSPMVRDAITIFEKNIPVIIFESMVALNQESLHPPLNSPIVPNNTFYNKLLVQLAWKIYYLDTFIKKKLFGAGFPSGYWIKKLAKRTNFPVKEIDFNRYFHIGLKNAPEIIASPIEFDFPRSKRDNQYYLGVSVQENRKEASYDLKYDNTRSVIENVVSQNVSCDPKDRVSLIYCSFGSMAGRYDGVTEFYQRLIEAFKNDTHIQIFISIGFEIHYHLFKNVPKHIHVFRKVPQVELLKQMDLMITHGGMNSITECIMAEVPMLVYPGFNEIDQLGNACRVQYHKIGLKGEVKKDSGKLIKSKVNTLLADTSFKTNIKKMKAEMIANNDPTEVLALFDNILQHKKTPTLKYVELFEEVNNNDLSVIKN